MKKWMIVLSILLGEREFEQVLLEKSDKDFSKMSEEDVEAFISEFYGIRSMTGRDMGDSWDIYGDFFVKKVIKTIELSDEEYEKFSKFFR